MYTFFVTDENRDINGHPDEDMKRQRTQYNGDQLYSNVSRSMHFEFRIPGINSKLVSKKIQNTIQKIEIWYLDTR